MKIAGRAVWFGEPPYTVAEMSGNHSGHISHAFRILGAARIVEADAVKIKSYRAETIAIDHLIYRVERTGKPIIISTAIASLEEICEALEMARLAFVSGAAFIEKLVRIFCSNGRKGSVFSLEPAELTVLVQLTDIAANSMGTLAMKPVKSEQTVWKNRSSPSVVALVRKRQPPDRANMRSIRQGGGFMPPYLKQAISRKIREDFTFRQPMNASMVTGSLAL